MFFTSLVLTTKLDWSCDWSIISYLVWPLWPHVKLTLQYWNGQTSHYDDPLICSTMRWFSFRLPIIDNSHVTVTSPILFPSGQEKEGETELYFQGRD